MISYYSQNEISLCTYNDVARKVPYFIFVCFLVGFLPRAESRCPRDTGARKRSIIDPQRLAEEEGPPRDRLRPAKKAFGSAGRKLKDARARSTGTVFLYIQ
jgi:hypothetical protein